MEGVEDGMEGQAVGGPAELAASSPEAVSSCTISPVTLPR